MCNQNEDHYKQLKERHDEVSKSIRSTMLTILTFGSYCLLTLSISEQTFLEKDFRIQLPIFGAEVQ